MPLWDSASNWRRCNGWTTCPRRSISPGRRGRPERRRSRSTFTLMAGSSSCRIESRSVSDTCATSVQLFPRSRGYRRGSGRSTATWIGVGAPKLITRLTMSLGSNQKRNAGSWTQVWRSRSLSSSMPMHPAPAFSLNLQHRLFDKWTPQVNHGIDGDNSAAARRHNPA